MDVCDGLVGVVGQGVDVFDGEYWVFEGGYVVEGDVDYEEFQYWIFGDVMLCIMQCQQVVDYVVL